MKYRLLILFLSMLCLNALYADPHKQHSTSTFLGPTFQLGYASSIYDMNSAYAIMGELGGRTARINAGFGWQITKNQRLKISAEYLWQNIRYAFFADAPNEWVPQRALGAYYRYDWTGLQPNPQINIQAYISHAPSTALNVLNGVFVNKFGLSYNFIDRRHVAGSNAEGMAVGLSVEPWCGNRTGADVNYDTVRYKKDYPVDEDAKGFGGTIYTKQTFCGNANYSLYATFRKPYNNYQASLNWINVPFYGRWTIDLDAAYTTGKNTLPNTWDVGLSANYFLDQRCESIPVQGTKDEILIPATDDFVDWTADPAVYIPQVLAIPDEYVVFTATG